MLNLEVMNLMRSTQFFSEEEPTAMCVSWQTFGFGNMFQFKHTFL